MADRSASKFLEDTQPKSIIAQPSKSASKFLGQLPTSQPRQTNLSEIVSTPQRGLRGLAIGGLETTKQLGPEQLTQLGIGGITQQPSILPSPEQIQEPIFKGILRANEAVDPQFTPQNVAEKLTSKITELGFTLGAGAAVAGPANLGLSIKVLRGALSGATISTLDQAINNNNIAIEDIQGGATVGSLFPLIGPTVSGVTKIGRELVRLVASGSRTLRPETVRVIEQTANLADDSFGNPKQIAKIIKTMQTKLHEVHEKIGKRLNKMRKNIGFIDEFIDDGITVTDPNFRPKDPENLIDSFNTLRQSVAQGDLKLRELLRLRKDAQELVSFRNLQTRQGVTLKPLTQKAGKIFGSKGKFRQFMNIIENEIEKIPKGKSHLAINKAYKISLDMKENLLKKLGNPDTTANTLSSLVKQNFSEIVDLDQSTLRLLRRLERRSGFKFLDQLQKEFTIKELREGIATGPIGLPGAGASIVGTVRTLRGGETTVRSAEQLKTGLTQPGVRAAGTLGLQQEFIGE